MVIQRIQSVYLLVCAILMAVMTFCISVGTATGADGTVMPFNLINITPLFVLDIIIAVLFLVDIFTFKNLPLQMKVIRICIVLTVVSVLLFCWFFIINKPIGVVIAPVLPFIFYAVVLVLAFLALAGCKRDHKLLTSYDRLR